MFLAVLVLAMAAANVWCALLRTAIPRAIDGVVATREVRPEKHPGIDDVLILHLDDGRRFVVERDLFDRLAAGDRIVKARWSTDITISGTTMSITPSPDLRGMARAMPIVVAVAVALLVLDVRAGRRCAAP